MPIRLDEMETSNNREAEGASFTRTRSVDMSDAFNAPDDESLEGAEDGLDEEAAEGESTFPVTDDQLLRLVKSAFAQGKSYQEQVLQPRWTRAYKAFNNEHASDSKYSSARFRGRSRLYRPKTRATARKKQAEAAAALFSTSQALVIKAGDESNQQQVAGAELMSGLISFRLDRASENAGIPWFQISMGSHMAAQQTGVCISKQYWEYRRELEGYDAVPVHMPVPAKLQPMIGMASIPTGEVQQKPRYRVVRDRPRIDLMPPEDVIRDPAAAWEDQAQDSAYLILRFPMTVEAAKSFLANTNVKSAVRFYEIPDEALTGASGGSTDPANSAVIRRARESSGTDRLSDFTVDNAYSQVWLHENFMRIDGRDYVFWTLGIDRLISDAIPVEEAYPEQGGARPVVIGVGSLEPFKIDPMSPVESWQELQREMNDLVNLRLDTLKQTIAPLAKVKRGRSVDIRAIQNRSPDTVVYMQDLTDVEFDRPAGPSSESYIEMEKLNADFDDQAGNFSTGSVQTNRQLGETVGGMKMMMSNANALGEFDLRVWVETWVERVLRQLVKLEQYYESDDNVLAISAKRAKIFQRFGVNQITDDMLTSQVAVSVDVGIGSSDPMISLQKFQQASQIVLGLLGPGAQARMKQDAVIDEVYGKAGYKDAADRFFNPADEQDQRVEQMKQAMQQMQGQLQDLEKQLKDKQAEIAARVKIAQIGAVGGLAKQEMAQNHAEKTAFVDMANNQASAERDRQFQSEQGEAQHGRAMEMQGAKADAAADQAAMKQMGPLGMPMPGGMAPPEQEEPGEQEEGAEGMEGGSIQQLLGLARPADPAAAVAPLVQTMMQGFKFLAQQMQSQQAALAQQLASQEQQTIQAILSSSEASDRQALLITRQLATSQQQTLEAVQDGNQRIAEILAAPKVLVRNPQTGAPEAVVPDLSSQQR